MIKKVFFSSIIFFSMMQAEFFHHSRHQNFKLQHHKDYRHYKTSWPWWKKTELTQGPHVCAFQVIRESDKRISFPWIRGSYCSQPTTVRYECCAGFSHLKGEPGCASIKPLKNLVELAKEMGSRSLIQSINNSGLAAVLTTAGAFTLFLPDDKGFTKVPAKMKDKLISMQVTDGPSPPMLMYHVIPKKITSHEFSNNMLIETLYEYQNVRINRSPHGLLTVNCAPLLKMDFPATNGIIHMIDRVIMPSYMNTIMDFIVSDPRLHRFAAALVKAKLNDMLREKGPFTVFAPTNEAFNHEMPDIIEQLKNNSDALRAFVKYHILHGITCASVIYHRTKWKTLEGSAIELNCNESHVIINNSGDVEEADIMASNGVIHITNRVLIPRRAKSVKEIVKDLKLTKVTELLGPANVDDVLSDNGADYTFFVPSDEAFEGLPKNIQEKLNTNETYAHEIFLYHLVNGRHLTTQMMDNQHITSMDSNNIRISVYHRKMAVEGAVVQKQNIEGRNGVVHLISKVLFPPEQTILEYLKEDENFSIFLSCLTTSSTRLINQLGNKTRKWTVFAPDNTAFGFLPFGTLERLLMDPQLLFKVVQYHILRSMVVMSALLNHVFYIYPTLGKTDAIKIYRDGHELSVGNAVITESDIMAINGVIHKISHVMIPE